MMQRWITLSLMAVSLSAWPCQIDLKHAQDSTTGHYDSRAEEYAARHSGTSPTVDALREEFIAQLPPGARILDLGCGPGRDSLWFKQQGFEVVAVDPSHKMADIAEATLGQPVLRQTAQDLSAGGGFHGVWAMASLIHVPKELLPEALRRISQELVVGGILHSSFIDGIGTPDVGEIESQGRFFSRVSNPTVRAMLGEIPTLMIDEALSRSNADDYHGADKPTATFGFYNLIARRVR